MYSKLRDKIVHGILMENYLDKYDFNKTVGIINDVCEKEGKENDQTDKRTPASAQE